MTPSLLGPVQIDTQKIGLTKIPDGLTDGWRDKVPRVNKNSKEKK